MVLFAVGFTSLVLHFNRGLLDPTVLQRSHVSREGRVSINVRHCTSREVYCPAKEMKLNITSNLLTLENLYEVAACASLTETGFPCTHEQGVALHPMRYSNSLPRPEQPSPGYVQVLPQPVLANTGAKYAENWINNVGERSGGFIDPVWNHIENEITDASQSSPSAYEMPQLLECTGDCLFDPLGNKKAGTIQRVSPSMRFKTCALVGSSGTLLLDEMGSEINDHEAVLRFNNAPTEGYEAHVGSKTSFLYLSFESIKKAVSFGEQTIRNWQDNGVKFIIFNYSERFHLEEFRNFTKLLAAHRDEPLPRFVAFDNTFHDYSYILLQRALDNPKALDVRQRPVTWSRCNGNQTSDHSRGKTSGVIGLSFMRTVCDKLDIYGFSSPYDTRQSPYHYFDDVVRKSKDRKFWGPQLRLLQTTLLCKAKSVALRINSQSVAGSIASLGIRRDERDAICAYNGLSHEGETCDTVCEARSATRVQNSEVQCPLLEPGRVDDTPGSVPVTAAASNWSPSLLVHDEQYKLVPKLPSVSMKLLEERYEHIIASMENPSLMGNGMEPNVIDPNWLKVFSGQHQFLEAVRIKTDKGGTRKGPDPSRIRGTGWRLQPLLDRFEFDSCALVGNSGSLLMDEMGEEIDKHDVVFRFSNAPLLSEYDISVGSRLTFMYLNKNTMDALAHSEAKLLARVEEWLGRGLRYIVLNYRSRFFSRSFKTLLRAMETCEETRSSCPQILAFDDGFHLYAHLQAWRSIDRHCQGEYPPSAERPSHWGTAVDVGDTTGNKTSGVVGLSFLRTACKTLDVYGLSSPFEGRATNFHYYDQVGRNAFDGLNWKQQTSLLQATLMCSPRTTGLRAGVVKVLLRCSALLVQARVVRSWNAMLSQVAGADAAMDVPFKYWKAFCNYNGLTYQTDESDGDSRCACLR